MHYTHCMFIIVQIQKQKGAMSRKCAGSRDIFSGGDSQPAGTRNLPGKTARGGHCRNFFTKNKETMINSCHLKTIKLTNSINWFSPFKKRPWQSRLQCTASPPESTGWGWTLFQMLSRLTPYLISVVLVWPSSSHVRRHWMQSLRRSDGFRQVWHRWGN